MLRRKVYRDCENGREKDFNLKKGLQTG